MKKILLFFFIPFLFTCSTRLKKDLQKIEAYQQESQKLLKQQALLHWFHSTQGTRMRLRDSFREHQQLLSLPTIQLVSDVLQETHNRAKAQELLYFKNFLLQKFMEMQTAALDDSLRNLLDYQTLRLGKKVIPLRELNLFLSQQRSPAQRKLLLQKARPYLETVKHLLNQKYQIMQLNAQRVGFPNYLAFCAEVYFFSPEVLQQQAQFILHATDSLYQLLVIKSSLAQSLSSGAINNPEYWPALFRQSEFPDYLSPASPQLLVKQFLKSLGIAPSQQTGLRLDIQKSTAKLLHAVCIPVDIPTDVRISLNPFSSLQDYIHLFYLLGEAEFYLHMEVNSWVHQQLGPDIPRRAYGQLFAGIWEEPAWVNRIVMLPPAKSPAYWWYVLFRKVFLLRYWAKVILLANRLLPQKNWNSQEADSLFQGYLFLMNYELPVNMYRSRFDPVLDAMLSLEASIINGQLVQYLRKHFGENWFENPKCGRFLRSLWWQGNVITSPMLLKKLEYQELTAQPLVHNLQVLCQEELNR